MTILKRTPAPAAAEPADLRRKVLELQAEVGALRAQLAGDIPAATYWLQAKVWRQGAALDALNRRVTSQRFVLRTLEGLGRGLSRDEYVAARAAEKNVQLRDRIAEQPEAYAAAG